MKKYRGKNDLSSKQRPRILLMDIETSTGTASFWGNGLYRQNLIRMEQQPYMLSFAYNWLNEDQIHIHALPEYKGYKTNKQNDYCLVKDLWQVLDEADIVIGHNIARFDVRKSNSRFLFHKLPPPSPYKEIDTLKIVRKYFALASNKLTDVCEFLGIGKKLDHYGIDLWFDCQKGDDAKAWRLMKLYNVHDVKILKALYLKIRGWAKNHPDLSRYFKYLCCPNCMNYNISWRGWDYSKKKPHRKIHCEACNAWSVV
jgi:hypothetical protein